MRVGSLPKDLAGLGLHAKQQGIVAAGGENNRGVVNNRALSRIPGWHGGAELPGQVQPPQQLASDRIQTDDVALGAHCDDELVRNGRHGARHTVIALDRDRIGITPNLTAVRKGETPQRILFLVAVVVHDIDPAI